MADFNASTASAVVLIDSDVFKPATLTNHFSCPLFIPKLIFPESFCENTVKTVPSDFSHEKSYSAFKEKQTPSKL